MLTTFKLRQPLRGDLAWGLLGAVVVACIAFFISPQSAWLALLAGLICWWSWHNPFPAFLLLLVASPLLPMFKVTQTLGSITLLKDAILLISVVRLVIQPALTKTLPYRRNILLLPLLVLVAWIILSAVRADTLLLGILRTRELLLYLAAYLIALYTPLSKQRLRELVGWLLLTFVAVLAGAAYQWWFAPSSAVLRFDPARQIWIPRLSSILAHPSVLGHYLILLIYVSLAVAFTPTPRKHRSWRPVQNDSFMLALPKKLQPSGWVWGFTTRTSHRLTASLLAILGLPLLYLTYSRAVWIGLAVSVVVVSIALLWQRQHRRLPWRSLGVYVLGGTLLLIIAAQFTQIGVFLKSSFDTQYKSNEVRLEYVARLLAPTTNLEAIVGRGLGDVTNQNFREVELTTYDIASTSSRTVQLAKDSTLVDNQYLKTFIEMGLVGLLIYAWIFIRLYRASWQLLQAPQTQGIGLVTLGFITAFAVQALFIDVWDIYPTNLAFWVVAGLASAWRTPTVVASLDSRE